MHAKAQSNFVPARNENTATFMHEAAVSSFNIARLSAVA